MKGKNIKQKRNIITEIMDAGLYESSDALRGLGSRGVLQNARQSSALCTRLHETWLLLSPWQSLTGRSAERPYHDGLMKGLERKPFMRKILIIG